MIKNVIYNNLGHQIQWTDTKDNRITKIENYQYKHYCSNCNTSIKDMQFIKETGYEDRNVIMKCKCNTIVKYQG